jgi:GalNAc-alpha-(1->4)-GalNAc-alpha-(1->3)-diNAcBac-PP-undecaprenol alpha-1,4-N-acetyl-D-galactosaminyltransferase
MLANSWAAQGREVTLITFDENTVPAYPLNEAVRYLHLGLGGSPSSCFRRVRRIAWRNQVLREAIRESRPDIVISFIAAPNIRAVLATRGLKIPLIVSERTDPFLYDIGWKLNTIRRMVYPFADMLVCQTTSCLNRFQKMTRVHGCVIPNLIAVPQELAQPGMSGVSPQKGHVLVAMGRLERQKGFDILLKAFSMIARRHRSWTLKIMGEGSLRGDLRKLSEDLNLTGQVHFAGVQVDPFAHLRQADLFVLSSRFEGFPNALCEAMACGLPAISFDCPSGPSDIIRHGIDGLLVPPEDTDALAAALDDLMTNKARRECLAARAPEVLERFSIERVLSLWDRLFAVLAPETMIPSSAPLETAFLASEFSGNPQSSL